jgi:hypothetical protein
MRPSSALLSIFAAALIAAASYTAVTGSTAAHPSSPAQLADGGVIWGRPTVQLADGGDIHIKELRPKAQLADGGIIIVHGNPKAQLADGGDIIVTSARLNYRLA